jgi:hypothetical protein
MLGLHWNENTPRSYLDMLELLGTTNLELLKSKVLDIEKEQINYFPIKKTNLLELYESTTLPELRNQILNTKVYLTTDKETIITNKMTELK